MATEDRPLTGGGRTMFTLKLPLTAKQLAPGVFEVRAVKDKPFKTIVIKGLGRTRTIPITGDRWTIDIE
jgi:hypothetical protein